MAETVLEYVNAQNRPFNAQNIADALGRHGIKKGMAQKYLDSLASDGKILVKEAGKQKVYFAIQDAEVMTPEEQKEAEATIKARTEELARVKGELERKHAKLRAMAQMLTVKQMKAKTAQLTNDNAALETKLGPLRAAGTAEVSASQMAKTEKEFVELVEMWSTRKRRFNDAFEIILESGGMTKKKLGDDLGIEWEDEAASEKLKGFKTLVDQIKRKRAIEARQKKYRKV